MNMENL